MASNQDAEDRLKAALADRYTIEREIGSGGMAIVYLAEDVKHNRKVAVKVLDPELAVAVGAERFLREIETIAKLTHPHILPLHDSGKAEGFLYYVMPYIEGESLRERLLREHELPVTEAARLLRDVVDALAAAHKHGVVHRDIKPENVLISGRHAMVTDFGVAKAVSKATGRHELTTRGMALGTPTYMAPEQATAEETIDQRADVYAVGAMAYELLTGRPPFIGGTAQQIFAAQLMESPQPVRELRESVPLALEALVMRCLEKKPADRWQSAEEMLPHLEAVATPGGGATPSDIEPLAKRASPVSRRRLARWVGVGTVAVAALAAGYFVLHSGGDEAVRAADAAAGYPPEDYVAVFPFENLTGNPELDQIGTIAAYVITEGFGWVDGLRAAATTTVAQTLQARGGAETVLDIASSLGVGTAVTGVYTLNGTVLEFRAEALRVATGEMIHAVQSSGSSSEPTVIMGDLRQRMLGGLAMEVLQDSLGPALPGEPPTLEALEAHVQGVWTVWAGDYGAALPLFYRAHELDSTFLLPLYWALTANGNMGRYATADSLAGILESRRGELSRDNRISLDWAQAWIRGDLEGVLQAARAQVRSNPDAMWLYLLGYAALDAGRPAEALEALEQIDLDSPQGRNWFWNWERLARGYHLTGRYQEALEVARQGQERFPEVLDLRWSEIRALIALDRLEEIGPLLDGVEGMELGEGGWSPGEVFIWTAAELARSGRVEDAREVADRASDWYLARDLDEYRWSIAWAYLQAGRSEEALALLGPLVVEYPEDMDVHGLLGVALALTGDTVGAEAEARWLEELDRPYLFGGNTYWRAAILAHLQRRDESIRVLRRAFQEGRAYLGISADPFFMPLWGFEPFEQLIAPRG